MHINKKPITIKILEEQFMSYITNNPLSRVTQKRHSLQVIKII